jgi:hypothetical protein
MSATRLSRAHEEILIEMYRQTAKTLDDLPYTEQFDQLRAEFVSRTGRQLTHHDLWRALLNLRKARRLVRKER